MASQHPKEFAHTIQRLKERYGVHPLSPHAFYDSLCQDIKDGWAQLVNDEPDNQQSIYRVRVGDLRLLAVWCWRRKCVTTVLPPGER